MAQRHGQHAPVAQRAGQGDALFKKSSTGSTIPVGTFELAEPVQRPRSIPGLRVLVSSQGQREPFDPLAHVPAKLPEPAEDRSETQQLWRASRIRRTPGEGGAQV